MWVLHLLLSKVDPLSPDLETHQASWTACTMQWGKCYAGSKPSPQEDFCTSVDPLRTLSCHGNNCKLTSPRLETTWSNQCCHSWGPDTCKRQARDPRLPAVDNRCMHEQCWTSNLCYYTRKNTQPTCKPWAHVCLKLQATKTWSALYAAKTT